MDIQYLKRHSKFLEPCESAIRKHRAELKAGSTVRVEFKEEEAGYAKQVTVTVRDGDRAEFGTDWEAADPSRFPQRIKAAATALLNCGFTGSYVIEHADGVLTIRKHLTRNVPERESVRTPSH